MGFDPAARGKADENSRKTGPFLYNTDIGLVKWRTSLAKLKAGAQQIVNVAWVGDSISEGQGSTNYRTKGYLGIIRNALKTKYGDVGEGFIPTFHPVDAPFWTFTGSWTDAVALFGIGGWSKTTAVNGTTAAFSFNGTGVTLYFGKRAFGGTMSINVDGTIGTQTVDTYSASPVAYDSVTISGLTDGPHTLNITSTVDVGQSKVLNITGALPLKGTAGVRVHTCSKAGTKSTDVSTTWSLPMGIDAFSPTLTVIALCANDPIASSLSSYITAMQALIDRGKSFGDVLLISTGIRTETYSPPQSDYAKAVKNLAILNNVAFIDLYNRWSGDANYAKNTLGLLSDTVHPNDYGHQDIATAALSVLLESQS